MVVPLQIIAFFVTARITQFYAELFQATGEPVVEMHSRKTQAYRTKAAETFRRDNRTIMFSSDVSARGVDYPDVSLVLQVMYSPTRTPCRTIPAASGVHLRPI